MDLELFFVLANLIVGLLISYLYMGLKYKNEMNDRKNCEEGMFNVFMLFLTVLWPITLSLYIKLKLDIRNGKQISRSEDKY
jgi:hypothetical protein